VIRIERAPEPPGLPARRARYLEAAREALRLDERLDLGGYGLVKDELFAMQDHKCCYCEKLQEQAKYRDVEHYRPKARYWWLTWTWTNLLFSCVDCNREHKGSHFPLAAGSVPLAQEEAPPGGELPLLLDPADPAVDPAREIVFRPSVVQGNERWSPYGLTERGRTTIEVCGLDRPGLLTFYASHVRDVVRPKLKPVHEAHRRRDTRSVHEAWNRAVRSLLHRARPFRALSRDAMDVSVPAPLRTRYGLQLADSLL